MRKLYVTGRQKSSPLWTSRLLSQNFYWTFPLCIIFSYNSEWAQAFSLSGERRAKTLPSQAPRTQELLVTVMQARLTVAVPHGSCPTSPGSAAPQRGWSRLCFRLPKSPPELVCVASQPGREQRGQTRGQRAGSRVTCRWRSRARAR